MLVRKAFIGVMGLCQLGLSTACAPITATGKATQAAQGPNKAVALEFFDIVFKSDIAGIKRLTRESYRQHDPNAEGGQAGLIKLVEEAAKAQVPAQGKVVRAIEDGSLVVTQSDVEWGGHSASFDMFRVEKGLIVEHWNVFQPIVEKTASGHGMLDGPTEITDREKTDANKRLVRDFYEKVLLTGQFGKIAAFFHGDTYVQHSPATPDGVAGFVSHREKLKTQGAAITITKLHYVVGEGNYVCALAAGKIGEKTTAFYDLFRLQDGKIVEHWDVLQDIPSEQKNNSGMF